jgi:hypothetical protein
MVQRTVLWSLGVVNVLCNCCATVVVVEIVEFQRQLEIVVSLTQGRPRPSDQMLGAKTAGGRPEQKSIPSCRSRKTTHLAWRSRCTLGTLPLHKVGDCKASRWQLLSCNLRHWPHSGKVYSVQRWSRELVRMTRHDPGTRQQANHLLQSGRPRNGVAADGERGPAKTNFGQLSAMFLQRYYVAPIAKAFALSPSGYAG